MTRRGTVVVGGTIFVVAVLASVWFGPFGSSAEVTATLVAQPTSTILSVAVPATSAPTATLLPPTVTRLVPTIAPSATQVQANPTRIASPTPTPVPALIIAGEGGANVRTGAGIDNALLGSLQPGTEARVTGQHDGWWQIDYNGSPGWVFGEIVTAQNTDGVPDPMLPPTSTPVVTVTSTLAVPLITIGDAGVNVRAGAGTDYDQVGYLEPGTEATVTGQHDGWWQIDYSGSPGWVFSEIVTAQNTEGVPDPMLPPTPTPSAPAATPTPIAPTPTAGPPTFNGLVAENYWVEGAPGPFNSGSDIWFNLDISCVAVGDVAYEALGTWVEETGQFQMSPLQQVFVPGQRLLWRDRITISAAGTYHLWLHICFSDTDCANMRGPVVVTVR